MTTSRKESRDFKVEVSEENIQVQCAEHNAGVMNTYLGGEPPPSYLGEKSTISFLKENKMRVFSFEKTLSEKVIMMRQALLRAISATLHLNVNVNL